jgi:hypothetical protein
MPRPDGSSALRLDPVMNEEIAIIPLTLCKNPHRLIRSRIEAQGKEGQMARKLAIGLAISILALVVWGLFFENNAITIVVNGQQVTGPLKGAIGAGGMVVALIGLFCVAILSVFVFAGLGIIVLGGLILFGVILAGFAFPFLLPLLIPLAVVWGFIALARHKF